MDYDVRIGILNVLLWWGGCWRQVFVLGDWIVVDVRKTEKWD